MFAAAVSLCSTVLCGSLVNKKKHLHPNRISEEAVPDHGGARARTRNRKALRGGGAPPGQAGERGDRRVQVHKLGTRLSAVKAVRLQREEQAKRCDKQARDLFVEKEKADMARRNKKRAEKTKEVKKNKTNKKQSAQDG